MECKDAVQSFEFFPLTMDENTLSSNKRPLQNFIISSLAASNHEAPAIFMPLRICNATQIYRESVSQKTKESRDGGGRGEEATCMLDRTPKTIDLDEIPRFPLVQKDIDPP